MRHISSDRWSARAAPWTCGTCAVKQRAVPEDCYTLSTTHLTRPRKELHKMAYAKSIIKRNAEFRILLCFSLNRFLANLSVSTTATLSGSRTSGSGPWTECSRRRESLAVLSVYSSSEKLRFFRIFGKAENGPKAGNEDNEEAQNSATCTLCSHMHLSCVPCHSLLTRCFPTPVAAMLENI